MSRWRAGLRQVARYPSAVAGAAIVVLLVALAVYTVIAIPYGEALERWRGGEVWQRYPVNAGPVWADRLLGGDRPATFTVSAAEAQRSVEAFPGGRRISIPLDFRFEAGDFPSEVSVFIEAEYERRAPFVRLAWETPDGRRIPLGSYQSGREERIALSQDWALQRRLGAPAHVGLFAAPNGNGPPVVETGDYRLIADAIVFEEDADISADLVVYGQVHGLAGTDHQRRSLLLALLWGTPVALAFGLIATVGTTVTTLIVAAVGVWYRGWVDGLIQRLTEVNMILPILPVLVMVGTLYSTSIWVILGVVIALGIFSASVKMYRAMLLPIREAPYIEAAQAYGASNARIIFRYMIPRILPVLIPTFVTLIPTFVFLEASLAVLGLGDPALPTWGKLLNDAQNQSALYHGYFYWVLEPAALLMLTGLGFAMLGFALDRVFNPRLRSL
ncbi:ABC transporter permease [Sediminicurvatus halobius]|uniref:ABC transporter permease n=1 Tax=Sediminicurvatus halobius TaxID=2182432 RepID=A0A2U2N3T4_9GAMM|nr:ABC transporter permease [Spiribacter halobius]PWG63727.1 ABC transporter permease [Spiribacter halobius]UEX76206.1 ABC transporter permease [Spiribacter halobius]